MHSMSSPKNPAYSRQVDLGTMKPKRSSVVGVGIRGDRVVMLRDGREMIALP